MYNFVLKGMNLWTIEIVELVYQKKVCVCREKTGFENAKAFVDIEIAVQFMIFITFEIRDKTCSKIEKALVSIKSMGGKKQ